MSRPGFNFLVCPDSELLQLELGKMPASHGGPDAFERKTYWAPIDDKDEPLPGAFWQDLDIPSLMGTPKFLVLRRANKMNADFWKAIESRLKGRNDSVWPVFCLEGEWNKGKPAVPAVVHRRDFWKLAQKEKWVWQSPGLTSATVKKFIQDFARGRGLDIPPGVGRELERALPLNAGAALRELEKIHLAAGESGKVEPAHLTAVSHQPDMDIFSFLKAALAGSSPEKVWAKVFSERNLSGDDKIFFGFLRLVHREARIFWELAAGEKPSVYVPRQAEGEKMNMARKIGKQGAADILDLVMAAEFGVKSGARTPEQAFESLVAGLHQISR
jgi:DNA polymerase-3 subunit delta